MKSNDCHISCTDLTLKPLQLGVISLLEVKCTTVQSVHRIPSTLTDSIFPSYKNIDANISPALLTVYAHTQICAAVMQIISTRVVVLLIFYATMLRYTKSPCQAENKHFSSW